MTGTSTSTVFAQRPRAGILRIFVKGHEQDVVAFEECVLGSVPVVRVDVDDRHPFASVGEGLCRDRNIVEEAESHRNVGRCVVPWRTNKGEGRLRFPGS